MNARVELLPWPSVGIAEELSAVEAGASIQVPDVLFAKIEDEQVAAWEERFGGGEP